MWPKQRSMRVRISSAPMRSAIDVEPTTSAKRTVTSFRSPSSAAPPARIRAARCAGVYDDGAGAGDGAPTRAPQRSQKVASSGSCVAHAAQRGANGVPHPRQKRASSRFSFPQPAQRTSPCMLRRQPAHKAQRPQPTSREPFIALVDATNGSRGGLEGVRPREAPGAPATHLYYFFDSATLPPFAVQSAAVVFVWPWPLQAFLPAQAWPAPAQLP